MGSMFLYLAGACDRTVVEGLCGNHTSAGCTVVPFTPFTHHATSYTREKFKESTGLGSL